MQDVRRKKPIKYNKDGSVSLDGSGVKILRLLDPQGEPDVIECDGRRYVPERTCKMVYSGDPKTPENTCRQCTACGAFEISNEFYDGAGYAARLRYCPCCGAKVVE